MLDSPKVDKCVTDEMLSLFAMATKMSMRPLETYLPVASEIRRLLEEMTATNQPLSNPIPSEGDSGSDPH